MENSEKENREILKWQKRLLPFIVGTIAAVTIFFFVASFIQLYYLNQRIEKSPELNLDSALKLLDNNETKLTNEEKLNYARWETLTFLEKHAMQRRYHQANVLLMARVWTSYLGFITGMILALVGSIFILGKLRESETKLDADTALWKFSITSASPGLILSLLGVTLMIVTILTHFEITVEDTPLFTPIYYGNSLPNYQDSSLPNPGSIGIEKNGTASRLDNPDNESPGQIPKDKDKIDLRLKEP